MYVGIPTTSYVDEDGGWIAGLQDLLIFSLPPATK